ncbi:MAG: hypothetical protein ABI891_08395 [Acidobacteriota bacterium]
MANSTPTNSIRALLTEIIDYAGLFPPSALSMPEAVANYAAYKNSIYNWMLGRFVLPVSRLDEFLESAKDFFPRDENNRWRLSVLASDNVDDTIRQIEDFNSANAASVVCDALEVKAETSSRIETIVEKVPSDLKTYFEIPIGKNLGDLVSTLAIHKQRAKIRTGGVTVDAFPKNETIVRFMRTCLAANVPFKATAGLHHPLRCFNALTYQTDAPEGAMNGFLNVFLAVGLLQQGYDSRLIFELLNDENADNFVFNGEDVLWRQEHSISTAQLRRLREKNIISFGSCSFDEPVFDLQEIELL